MGLTVGCDRGWKIVIEIQLVLTPFTPAEVVVALRRNVIKRREFRAKHHRLEGLTVAAS